MTSYPVHVAFPGRLIFVGFGSIGQGVLPLILRHVGLKPEQITIVTADEAGAEVAQEYGVRFVKHALTRENHKNVLDPLVGRGDFLLNLSVDVSSIALIRLCWEKGALYLDTCIEPWPGGYTDPAVAPVAAHQLCVARGSAGAARQQAPPDGRADPRRQPRPRLALRQAGAAQHRERHGRRRSTSRTRAANGRRWRTSSASRSSTSPSAIRRSLPATRRKSASSSTPGRSTASSAKAASRPSSAGVRTKRTGRATAGSTSSAAAARST